MRLIPLPPGAIFMIAIILFSVVSAADIKDIYHSAIGKYFEVSKEVITKVSETGTPDEEIPVIVYIAQKAKADPIEIAALHAKGQSLQEIAKARTLKPVDFYVLIEGEFESKTFKPVYEKFGKDPKRKWELIPLTDSDLINMINLKMIYSHHDYSVYKIMAMRDVGKGYARINQQVDLIKQEMNKKKEKKSGK